MRCLVIEDEPEVALLTKEKLELEGFDVQICKSCKELDLLGERNFSFVLLDLWLPDCDGLDLIGALKKKYLCPVLIISAHSDPDVIVRALRMGADYYIEKPINFEKLLSIIGNLRSIQSTEKIPGPSVHTEKFSLISEFRGRRFRRKTIKQSCILMGIGIHSGKRYGLKVCPNTEFNGIYFNPLGSDNLVPLSPLYAQADYFCSKLVWGPFEIKVIEHLLAALRLMEITDCVINCGAEVPILDGSAKEFILAFQQSGFIEGPEDFSIGLKSMWRLGFGDGKSIELHPSQDLSVRYTLEVGGKEFTFEIQKFAEFGKEISEARTFAFLEDVKLLHKQGYAQGGRFNNFVLLDSDLKPLNDELRFPDEPVRHKILDLIGDLFSLGLPLDAKIIARKTGHRENLQLAKKIFNECFKSVDSSPSNSV